MYLIISLGFVPFGANLTQFVATIDIPDLHSEVLTYAWNNVWEWGLARRAHDLANAGYKVGREVTVCPK